MHSPARVNPHGGRAWVGPGRTGPDGQGRGRRGCKDDGRIICHNDRRRRLRAADRYSVVSGCLSLSLSLSLHVRIFIQPLALPSPLTPTYHVSPRGRLRFTVRSRSSTDAVTNCR